MTEIPEHLLARSKAAKDKQAAEAPTEEPEAAEPAETAPSAEEDAGPEPDPARDDIVALFAAELGDDLVSSHVEPGRGLWLRVSSDAWRETALVARTKAGCAFFDWLSAIDWLPSPFGRDMDSVVDKTVHGFEAPDPEPIEQGYAGGSTRFQVIASYLSVANSIPVVVKADVPDDTVAIESIIPIYAGANWHEREAWEMFGIDFIGHPDVRHIYLPGGFEGRPLRKDYPLLQRRVKPWPGIVDVEGMPGDDG